MNAQITETKERKFISKGMKMVGKLVLGVKKCGSGGYTDEIAGIYKVGENQYKILRVACGKITHEIEGIFSAKDFVNVGREAAYSASRMGLLQYTLLVENK